MLWSLAGLALARDVLAPPPEKVDTVAIGLTLSRKGADAEGGEPPSPKNDTQAEYEAWVRVTERYKDGRAELAALDAVIADLSPETASCAYAAGATAGQTATVAVTASSVNGILSARATGNEAPALAACAVAAWDKVATPFAYHGGSPPRATYRVTLTEPPARVREGIDRFDGIVAARFGSSPSDLVEGRLGSTHRNAQHYTRAFDDNVRFLAVPCVLVFSFDGAVGLYGYRVRVSSDSGGFALHDRIKSVAGQGTWDNDLKGWYWRSAEQVWVTQRSPDGKTEELTVLHVERARAAGMVSYLPGDRDETNPTPGKMVPRVLREQGAAPAPTEPVAPEPPTGG
jgi:hypothetical protein